MKGLSGDGALQGQGESPTESSKAKASEKFAELDFTSFLSLRRLPQLAAKFGLTLLITVLSILMAGAAEAAGLGDTGPYVSQIQRALGVSDDGVFGSETESAVISFQRRNGLTPDGVVGSSTSQALLDAAIPDYGPGNAPGESGRYPDSGSTLATADLQRLLRDRGFDPGSVDGVYGPGTTEAVTAAQRFYGIQVDGVAGIQTVRALQSGASSTGFDPGGGSSLIDTARLQRLLRNRGYYSGAIDGVYGPGTQQAVRNFQRDNGLAVDGVVGPQTLASLQTGNSGSVPTPAPFESGREISYSGSYTQQVQQLLRDRGYYSGAIDGVYGAATRQAVRQFQRDAGLVVDGDAGAQTLVALQSGSANAYASGGYNGSYNRSTRINSAYLAPLSLGPTGSYSTQTAEVQRLLRNRGFYSGAIDGVYGSGTVAAVRQAQRFYGLPVDGIAGSQTLAYLQGSGTATTSLAAQIAQPTPRYLGNYSASPASGYSSRTAEVQRLLRDRGFYTGPIDGVLGSQTQQALEDAQRFYGTSDDRLFGLLAPQY